MSYIKYPRTFHLPWSEGATNDDKVLKNVDYFLNKEVMVSVKLDGENASLYNNYLHARSIDSKDHPSRHWLKQLQQQIGYKIPDNWRICGENLFAQHSIPYNNLPSYFLAFSIWNENNICLSWDDTVDFLNELELLHVPILYHGIWDEEKIKQCFIGNTEYGKQEGYVVRIADSFNYNDFNKYVAKFVRKSHVQTDNHWMHSEVIKNKLKL